MALNQTALDAMADQLGTLATHMSLHNGDPGTTGINETSAGRQTITWSAAASGNKAISAALNFTGGAASGTCTFLGLWSAAAGGTFYGGFALTGDQTFNASGQYTVSSFTIDGTSS